MFDGVTLPFSPAAMLGEAMDFLSLYGVWIVVVLGVIFSPVLYGLVMKLVNYVAKQSFDSKHGRGSSDYWGEGGKHSQIMEKINGK